MRILYCDDDQELLKIVRLTMEPRGHKVDVADRAERAIEIFEAQQAAGEEYDLIMTDVIMPGDSGYFVAGAVRARGYTGRLAIVTCAEPEPVNLAAVDAEYWQKPTLLTKMIDFIEAGK